MKEIRGDAKTIRQLLSGNKYAIDYYQREYSWQTKQVQELLQDLAGKFLNDFEPSHERQAVENYGHYFLGSIIISQKEISKFIIDGQQRLTTISLLLIFLHNLQKSRSEQVKINDLIYSEKFSIKSFNLNVEERNSCMEALFNETHFDDPEQPESVKNIVARYGDIKECFSEDLTGEALPYFIDWLIENVHIVEITAYSDEDAYTIFETMNDRGLSLTPTDMLKGFMLANISDEAKKEANRLWKKQVNQLKELGKEEEADAIKTWLRSQYAQTIRERKKGAVPGDFDRISTEFHRWVRDHKRIIGLHRSTDFVRFIERDFAFYTRQYLDLREASISLKPDLEEVFYNARQNFTLQYPLLLASLNPDDNSDIINKKIRLVATFIDILLARRLWNFRTITYSTMEYAIFVIMRDIRGKAPAELAKILRQKLDAETEVFASCERLQLHRQNYNAIYHFLARITDYIECQSGVKSRYSEYIATGSNRYEIEHIWANKPERHLDEFSSEADFYDYRDRIGGLLLLPKSFNASYGDSSYAEKLPHYIKHNLLAQSLNPQCYNHNPGFLAYKERSGLPFQPHEEFKKADLDTRQKLYQKIAEEIWNPDRLNKVIEP
ncbi:DUF262 domain-containing HNH endonuclease family protein [Aetokthonos hydrillicola Thurmond2011]|jgi:uncharacterized protein with ParB-like and HNH nuclease domain|uniref:DUF262 domain-containing HNH endonuclease family protein n=1 Tax=Aetokthonos hydrillicola Thurmond2011 TaxID=2712845 RepID=A0AAP5MB02_9CYAN|nr:DUF262 domain-containing protein [Aetokthonos hydrillicola]MBO3462171.1 DUF262 domain-containing protein [Aetokthonos hydrillicola CCALA 1050]MBW4588581.1 DUF262 domain-containing HNH endonuclease family protein [Aetokthonos hydrillicola CCALA 1050]MDR9896254.1 DUF262 domain-containing HNH endonuclease family protein [Aetokthonos hydrillicola Thurmond2011]